MYQYRIRIRNRLRQLIYKPKKGKYTFLPMHVSEALDAIDKEIEDTISPLLEEFFR